MVYSQMLHGSPGDFVSGLIYVREDGKRISKANQQIAIGAITILVVLLVYRPANHELGPSVTWLIRIRKIELFTPALLVSSLTALFLALQWGGTVYKWSNARIVVCLVVFVCFSTVFVIMQWARRER